MAVLFISHSTRDDALATGLVAWLKANGFSDIFIDHESIAGGDKWRDALRASASSCRVVIPLVTPNWLASAECFGEFVAAWYMGKRLIPLFHLPAWSAIEGEARTRLDRVTGEDQGLDIAGCIGADGALDLERDASIAERLRAGLRAGLRAAGANMRVGLDPEAFAIDRALRPTPFPGLASFEDEDADAALFYGRSREIAEILENLRAMRATGEKRPLFILGASGAGKSSLLKAGIIPRLRRERPAWLPLRAFRPGADPLLNFAESLARTRADWQSAEAHGVIRDRLLKVWSDPGSDQAGALASALEAEGAGLRKLANAPGATILISVDQAEELARADTASGEALAAYLRAALASETGLWQLAFTIRTDSFPELQRHPRFADLQARGYDLRAVPVFRFDTLVEEPAKRYGVEVDPALVDKLMADAPKEDALPLLAFALQRLWRQYAASGRLTEANYQSVGGLKGLIEDAAERALRGIEPERDAPLPASFLPKHLDDLGAATFVPALVQINDEGATIRRVAEWREFDERQQDLLGRLDRWRLVVRKGADDDGGTVEVAHEALFREWTRLEKWLEPERDRLKALRSLQLDAATWDRAKHDANFLNHRGARLKEAEDLPQRERYAERIGDVERDYLAACRQAEDAAQEKERASLRSRKRMQAAVTGLMAATIAGLVGWINQDVLAEQWRWYTTIRPYIQANMAPHILTAERERALKPGDSFRECAEKCPEMVVIPAGTFVMGSHDGVSNVIGLDGREKPGTARLAEEGRQPDEGPPREVRIASAFAVGKFEVTFDDYEECVKLGGCEAVSDSGWGTGPQPVINISWVEAKQYAAWLSRMTGKEYRLLTEAEWEYAARAGTQTAYSFGDKADASMCLYANFADRSLKKAAPDLQTSDLCEDGHGVPAHVGRYRANGFGLHDMHGNVFEWVQDCYVNSYAAARRDGSAVLTSANCPRVLRGGSWVGNPLVLRSAVRNWFDSSDRNYFYGFRVSRTITP